MKKFLSASIATTLIAATPASAGQLTFTEETTFYEFSARNLHELERAIHEASPIETDGEKYLGSTGGKYSFDYAYDMSGGKCGAKDPHLTIRIIYTMPKWINYAEGTKQAKDEWDRFYAALEAHEKGHAEVDRKKAKEILALIPRIEPQSSCSLLHELAVKKVAAISSDEVEGKKYDADTNHGETEGAKLRVPARPSFLTSLWAWING